MMKRTIPKVLIPLLVLTACDPSGREEAVMKAMSLKFDPELSEAQKDRVVDDIYSLLHYDLEPKSSVFAQVFGGQSSGDVVRYLDDRINYIIPPQTKIESRIELTSADAVAEKKTASVIATNIGMALWLTREAARPANLAFHLGDSLLPVESARIGLIQLGEAYFEESYGGISRLDTLVHEARHSDCTGGLKNSDRERLKAGKLPEDPSCGHLHSACPAGHQFEGLPACDDHPWGAYAVEAVFALQMGNACKNCSDEDKAIAAMQGLDSLSRLSPEVLEIVLVKHSPAPDMSSSDDASVEQIRTMLKQIQAERSRDLTDSK